MGDNNSEGREKNAATPLDKEPMQGGGEKGGKAQYEGSTQGQFDADARKGEGLAQGGYGGKGGFKEQAQKDLAAKGDYQGGERSADEYGGDDPGRGTGGKISDSGKTFDDHAHGHSAGEKRSYAGEESYSEDERRADEPVEGVRKGDDENSDPYSSKRP